VAKAVRCCRGQSFGSSYQSILAGQLSETRSSFVEGVEELCGEAENYHDDCPTCEGEIESHFQWV
jgi:hypothetical protein